MKITSATLANQTRLSFGDFNVIIGGNGVGKSLFLEELFCRSAEIQRPRWYWLPHEARVEWRTDNPARDLHLLLESMVPNTDGTNQTFYSKSIKSIRGTIEGGHRDPFSQHDLEVIKQLATGKGSVPDPDPDGGVGRLVTNPSYRRPFIAYEGCGFRLTFQSSAPITAANLAPTDAANLLRRDRNLLAEIDQTLFKQFNYHLALLDHLETQIEIGVSRTASPTKDLASDPQREFARVEQWKVANFLPIPDAGNGLMSIIKMLMSLLDPVNQVILIDEPELFLYSSQKRWLGRELVALAKKQGKQVFLVTHDPLVLQGLLDSPSQTNIFRISIDDTEKRLITHCALDNVTDLGAQRNQDSYLQALFYHRSIAVEGASDRAFYQILVEELFPSWLSGKDLGFVSCGGKGASKHMAYIATQVNLECAFIFDFDALLFDIPVVKAILIMPKSGTDAIERLTQLLKDKFDLDPKRIRDETNRADKEGLNNAFVKHHLTIFASAMSEAARAGIFVVPNGDLESWAPSVEHKARFAELAPDVIKADVGLRSK